ncbi:variable surface lipoprotein [Mycoplasmopsis bovis]|uniref:variable surface lipoprotein n=1 Tax=Mycoplasmopsis bovis TaxID=28903 RepID=UPI00244EB461|nr:variable surface lipoprotein [Mycoplasmopsis bovis]
MKKSKFLLLGSVASLASIPFVAKQIAKCGETQEVWWNQRRKEKKKGNKLTVSRKIWVYSTTGQTRIKRAQYTS